MKNMFITRLAKLFYTTQRSNVLLSMDECMSLPVSSTPTPQTNLFNGLSTRPAGDAPSQALTGTNTMNHRLGTDRRNTSPFGTQGPWLTTGKMGGMVFTDRRKAARRGADTQEASSKLTG